MKPNDKSPWSGQTLRVFQEFSAQNKRALNQSLRGLSPSISEQVRAFTGTYRWAEQARKLTQTPESERIFADLLAQTKLLPSSQIKAAWGMTLSDSLRETVATLAGQSSLKAKLAATSILGEQATLARIRIPQQRLLDVAATSSWQGLSRTFAQRAAEALSVAGMDAERELQRIRDAVHQEREAARGAWESAAAQAGSTAEAAPDAGLEEVPALIEELITQMRSLATAVQASTKVARGKVNMDRAALLVAVIALLYAILSDHVEPFMPKAPPLPQAQPSQPRSKAHSKAKPAATKAKPSKKSKSKQNRSKR